jgi:hypothetical protein
VAVLAIVLLLTWPFLSRAQIALDQPVDSGAITPTSPVVGQPAGAAGKSDELKVLVTLKDGSQIIGTPVFKALTVTTPYGKLEAKAEMLESVQFTPDHDKVNVIVRNGDVLTGSLGIHEFEITTLFGKIRVDTAVVTSLKVFTGLQPALMEDLVLYFSFDGDENGKVTDKSGKGNNGAIRDATWVPNGKLGGACSFNAVNEYINVPNSSSMGVSNLTISAWIYVTDTTGNDMDVAEKGPHLGGWELQMWRGGQIGHNYLILRGGSIDAVFATSLIPAGEWHHVAGTIYGTSETIYVDGILNATGTVASVPVTSSSLYIGKSFDPNAPFGGQIDEVMIFDRALSAEEVKKLYDSQR